MIGEPERTEPASDTPAAAEDTVEFELTAEQQLALWQAAGALTGSREGPAATSGYDTYICRRTDRVDRVCTIAFATLVLGLTVATGWRAMARGSPAPAVVASTTSAPTLAVPPRTRPPVVQVLNPFDPTEVFELPANITESGARDAIAQLLLQRARERFPQGFDVHRVTNRRPHATPTSSPDVFVTQLSPEGSGGISGLSTQSPAAD